MVADTLRRRLGLAYGPTAQMADGDENGSHACSSGISRPAWLRQIVKYSAVGVSNTALDAILYFLLTHFLGLGSLRVVAKTISYGAGTLNSFHWNRSWTFRSSARAAATLLPYVLVSLVALGINAAAMYLSLQLFSQREIPAFVVATGVTLLWNFALTKFVIFRR